MEYGYSILMGIFSLVLLIYAAIMAISKNYEMLPYRAKVSVNPKDPELYMTRLAKVIALVALAPALSAIIGLWNKAVAFIILILLTILFIWKGTKMMEDMY